MIIYRFHARNGYSLMEASEVPDGPYHDDDGHFMHYCHCGRWGDFGYDYFPLQARLGKWFCREHRPT